MFTLYTTPLSANGRKVLALSHHLGLRPQVRLINVYRGEGLTPEYLSINPTGKIPALVEGSFILSESNAILQYIAEAHGDCTLFSRDPRQRALINRWLFWEASEWQPSLSAILSPHVGHRLFPQSIPAPAGPAAWDEQRVQRLLVQLNDHLAIHSFLATGDLTIADFAVGGMMTYFTAAQFPFDAFPGIGKWYGRLEASRGWRESADPLWAGATDKH